MSIHMTTKLRIVQVFLSLNGILLFFWWPLSHWFYSDLYHKIMGFGPVGAYDSFIKIIGTCGVVPVLLMLLSAVDPLHNRTSIIILIVFGLLLGATFGYLTASGLLPVREYFNAALSLLSAAFLLICYPWRQSRT